jgi:peptidoglycan hydrolase-like protein with peptidoglycan-binding domain
MLVKLSTIRFVGFALTLWGVFCFSLFSVMAADSTSANKCPGTFKRELKLGSVGEDVRQLQSYLNNSGFAVAISGPGTSGNETTFFGSLTKIALTNFQTANGLTATGSFDFATKGFLGCGETVDNASEFGRDLQFGMQGDDVLKLQQYLNNQGFKIADSGAGSPGHETNYFGRLTQEAVKRLQSARGVPADGIFRPSLIIPVETKVALTYMAGLHGSISGVADQTIIATGTGDRVTAVPDRRYRFAGWSDGVSSKSRVDYGRDGDKMVTANFKRRPSGGGSGSSPVVSYTLTYLAGEGGTISGSSSQTVVAGGSGTEVTAVPDSGYDFSQWSDGVLTAARTDTNITANLSVTATFAAEAVVYDLRDTGPGGGLVFYDKGEVSDGWRYLEVAPADASEGAVWGATSNSVAGADGVAIGTGEQNTLDIIAGDLTADKAVDLAAAYTTTVGETLYDDWFLPSKAELVEIYNEIASYSLGSLAANNYWSSSEATTKEPVDQEPDYAWPVDMTDGWDTSVNWKEATNYVRAVRKF